MGVSEHEAADWLASQVHGDTQDGLPAKFLPHRAWQARQILQAAPILAIPAKTFARPLQAVPAHAGVRVIEQEAIAPVYWQVFRRQARIVAGLESPHKDALQFGIA